MTKRKIIIDTDIGDDIDDALAVSYALHSPELDVIGITTVFRDTAARAKIARKLLQLAGRDEIPVYAGCQQPLINRYDPDVLPCQYGQEMSNLEYNRDMDAVDYIINRVTHSDGDITLVPIGPLTNIANVLSRKPELRHKLREIVLMGGAYFGHSTEWNVFCDPEAARIVFESGVAIKAIGLDVTLKCQWSERELEKAGKSISPLQKFLYQLVERWREVPGNNLPHLHDPLAIYAIGNEEFLEFEDIHVAVETKGELTRGTTFSDNFFRKPTTNAAAARYVKSREFMQHFMDRVFN